MNTDLPDHLRDRIGTAFPGGTYLIEPYRAWLMADTVCDEPDALVVHPVHAWLGATEAMGLTWDELFFWFDATAADGPMIGEHETQIYRPLRLGYHYTVTGHIVSVERKQGKAIGLFDLMRYQLNLHDEAGQPVARCTNSIVFPRSAA